jgi:HSP20 family protein
MGIVRFDPFRELDRLQSEVNRLFEGYNGTPERSANAASPMQSGRMWSPAVDVAENQNEIVLRAEIPGMKQDEIDIELTGDTLTLRGERKFENEERAENFVRVERSYGRFQRSFTLGIPIQHDKVSASYKDGVLEIHLPKSEETKPRKVTVTVANGSSNGQAE